MRRQHIERLERRTLFAVTASFDPVTRGLRVFGDELDNTITLSRTQAGDILVNYGAVEITGGTPTVANTGLMTVFAHEGNDTIAVDEANGPLPRANLLGFAGNDTLTGASGDDELWGQAGNDTLLGGGGEDLLFGHDGNDVLTGGDGDDLIYGDDRVPGDQGDDRMVWNPGDDEDVNEGGAGTDTVEVNGGGGPEQFGATAIGSRVRFNGAAPAAFAIDIGTSENLVLNANAGDDSFFATGNLAALIRITVDGGAGNDTLLGSNGADRLLGGDGNDRLSGRQGDDVVFLGAGDDAFSWDAGDGNDTLEGQGGADILIFRGDGADEIFEASANGGRLRFTRNVGNITMDANGVERLDLDPLGGSDTVTFNDLAGTGLTQIYADLAGFIGNTTGDGQADTVTVNGTYGNDTVTVTRNGPGFAVSGLAAALTVFDSEAAHDTLVVNVLGGDDTFSTTGNLTALNRIAVDGGGGNDTFNVTPSANLTVHVKGSDPAPPAAPGDVLQLNLDGATGAAFTPAGSGAGTYTFANRGPVSFVEIERFSDLVAPTVLAPEFVYQSGAPHRVLYRFSKPMDPASLDAGDLTVRTVPPGGDYAPAAVSYDAATQTATFTFPAGFTFPNGNYRATLAGPAVVDAAGNAMAADHVFDFFSLAGDVNRDRAVNATDFSILAANFGKTGITYAQGDLTGDGRVDGTDFALLAGNFGRSVPPTEAAVSQAAAAVAARPGVPTAAPRPKRAARAVRPARPSPTPSRPPIASLRHNMTRPSYARLR